MNKYFISIVLFLAITISLQAQKQLTKFVNPLLGTATLWDSVDIGFRPMHRTWGAEVFPGSSLPNAMVQLTPVTQFHSGSGYQYEDTVIYGFAHTSKGHWNLCNIPLLPATGTIAPDNYILSVPLFDKAEFTLGGKTFTIIKKGSGKTISDVTYDNKKVDDIFISHDELLKGKKLVINTK